jgi:hypothetical protein
MVASGVLSALQELLEKSIIADKKKEQLGSFLIDSPTKRRKTER